MNAIMLPGEYRCASTKPAAQASGQGQFLRALEVGQAGRPVVSSAPGGKRKELAEAESARRRPAGDSAARGATRSPWWCALSLDSAPRPAALLGPRLRAHASLAAPRRPRWRP